MSFSIQLATAPCSWGVDFADRPENPAWDRILNEASSSGFDAIDLGPVGYFPTDVGSLRDALAERELVISAGGLFDPFTDPAAFPKIVDKTRRTCALLSALGAPRLVIIDGVSEERGRTAGQSDHARRLDAADWSAMMERMAEVARIAQGYGVRSTLHAHAGCFIEFEDEVDRAMEALPADLVGLCIDTGHSAYAGIDPVALIKRYGDRVQHMHFKNIDPVVHAKCVSNGVGFFDAIAEGVFCPLGSGVVDFVAVRDALAEIGYEGMAVVEQDVDPTGNASPLENARESHGFLRSIGLHGLSNDARAPSHAG